MSAGLAIFENLLLRKCILDNQLKFSLKIWTLFIISSARKHSIGVGAGPPGYALGYPNSINTRWLTHVLPSRRSRVQISYRPNLTQCFKRFGTVLQYLCCLAVILRRLTRTLTCYMYAIQRNTAKIMKCLILAVISL